MKERDALIAVLREISRSLDRLETALGSLAADSQQRLAILESESVRIERRMLSLEAKLAAQ
jgi:hypothetical protein